MQLSILKTANKANWLITSQDDFKAIKPVNELYNQYVIIHGYSINFLIIW